jgi:hypothetical protein
MHQEILDKFAKKTPERKREFTLNTIKEKKPSWKMEFPASKMLDQFFGASIMEKSFPVLFKNEDGINIYLDKQPPEPKITDLRGIIEQ